MTLAGSGTSPEVGPADRTSDSRAGLRATTKFPPSAVGRIESVTSPGLSSTRMSPTTTSPETLTFDSALLRTDRVPETRSTFDRSQSRSSCVVTVYEVTTGEQTSAPRVSTGGGTGASVPHWYDLRAGALAPTASRNLSRGQPLRAGVRHPENRLRRPRGRGRGNPVGPPRPMRQVSYRMRMVTSRVAPGRGAW